MNANLEYFQLVYWHSSIEIELKEKTEELKQLQDDNSFLHHDLEDKRENIQKLLQRYQNCEKELADQNRELDTLQKQFTSEKEIIKQLEDKIQHLEEVIRTRETELEDKEKDIHLLTLQLNEHQSTLDQSLASAEVKEYSFFNRWVMNFFFRIVSDAFLWLHRFLKPPHWLLNSIAPHQTWPFHGRNLKKSTIIFTVIAAKPF